MPGRLLDVLNRVVSRTEPSKPEDSSVDNAAAATVANGNNKKKVSFSKKVNFKPFRSLGKKSAVKRDGNNVVAYLQSGSSASALAGNRKTDSGSKKYDTGSGRSVNAGGEFWFNVHRRTATSPSSSTGNINSGENSLSRKRDSSASRPSIYSTSDVHSCLTTTSPILERRGQYQLNTASLPTPARRAARARRRAAAATTTGNKMASATYAYDVDPSLHDSQKPSQVPRVKRNLVRDIVDKFNEEAKKRGSTENLLSDSPTTSRTTSPPSATIEATPENAPNHAIPFSYTVTGGVTSPPPPLVQQRSREYGGAASPIYVPAGANEVIYAQVQVVNGHQNGQQHKTTVHTSVPARHVPETVAPTSKTNRKLFSKSTGSLHRLDDSEMTNGIAEERVLDYQRRNKDTDHSYYKFDRVDDQGAEYGRNGDVHNGSSNQHGSSNGSNKPAPLKLRGGGRFTDSEDDRISFSPPPSSRHQLIQLHDPAIGRAAAVRSPVGGSSSRNVEKWSEKDGGVSRTGEKWSEKEVGPNSKKFTEHEYIHEVSVSNDPGEPLPPLQPPVIRDPLLPLRSGSGLAPEMSLKEKFNLLMRGEDPTLSAKENESPRGGTTVSSRHHQQQQQQHHSSSQEHHSRHRSKSREHEKKDEEVKDSLIWPPPRRRETTDSGTERFSPDLKPTYYFGEPTDQPPSTLQRKLHREEQHHHQREHRTHHHHKTDKSKTDIRPTPLVSRLGLRRNSNDSTGSGVGLLSSKLVKKANAEVNGYDLDNLNFRSRYDDDHDRHFRFDSERGHFGSTSRLNTALRPVSPLLERPTGTLLTSTAGGSDYNAERKRIYKREETHTKKHTRSSSSHPRHQEETLAERHRLTGSASPPGRNPTLKQRHDSSERSESRSVEREEQRHQRRSANEDWNESNLRRSEQSRRHDATTTNTTTRRHRHHHHRGQHQHDADDKMETSGSEPQLYGGGGSQDSHMSLGSRLSSTDEETAEDVQRRHLATDNIIAAHVNTPDSLVRQMNRKQINYENSQHHHHRREDHERSSTPTGRRLWFERAADEVDDVRLDANRNPQRYSPSALNDNSRWTGGSATMSRLETSKNRRNNAERIKSSTVDRRNTRPRNQVGDDIRIQLNDRDIATLNGNGHLTTDGHHNQVGRSSSFNSRVGSYHSENESQHSTGSNGRQKRVNFKASGRNGHSNGHSNGGFRYSELSPIHREALLRSASPARAPSVSGSLRSDASDASGRSVILHATAVADIPPARQYRARSAATSPAPARSVENVGRESRTVQRSFSLLSPWKSPRKYNKEKRRDSSGSSGVLRQQNGSSRHEVQQTKTSGKQQRKQQEGNDVSHDSSSERLDSLPPLQSESGTTPVKVKTGKKKSGILRRHSMPKDSRFANFFRRKKEAKTKEH